MAIKHIVTATGLARKINAADWDSSHILNGTAGSLLGADGVEVLPGALGHIGLFTAAGAVVIGSGINLVQTSGRSVAGVYPARYVRSAAADQNLYTAAGNALIAGVTAEGAPQIALAQTAILAILNLIRFVDSTGSYWEIEDTAQEVHAGHFGAVADASYTEGTGVTTGTDSQPAIQALIDWRVYLKSGTASANRDCVVPAGSVTCGRADP